MGRSIKMEDLNTICLFLQKGGVGKSTMTSALAYELSKYGKTLIIDGDTQGSITSFFTSGISEDKTFLKVLKEDKTVEEATLQIREANDKFKGLYLLGTRPEDELIRFLSEQFKEEPELLDDVINAVKKCGFKYLLFDLPPSLDFFERQVLKNCNTIIPIVEPEDAAVEQLKLFNKEMMKIKKRYAKEYVNSNMLIINKRNKQKDVHNAYSELLNKRFECYEFIDSKIVSKAINQKLAVQEFDPSNKMSKTLEALVEKN